MAATSAELSGQSEYLQNMIDFFRLQEGGSEASLQAAIPAPAIEEVASLDSLKKFSREESGQAKVINLADRLCVKSDDQQTYCQQCEAACYA